MKRPQISAVVAIGKNRVLGKGNKLIWNIPDDLKRFRTITRGHPVIMGRKTFESIVAIWGSGLPDRPNIVITRDPTYVYGGRSSGEVVIVAHSLEDGIAKAKKLDQEEISVIGGGQIFDAALPLIDKLYLTLIDDEKDGDSYFPAYEDQFTKKTFEETHEWEGLKYTWVNLERE